MRYTTVSDYLQVIPNRKVNTSYEEWLLEYKVHLQNLFLIFTDRLENVKEDAWHTFTQYIYKKSSGVV
jgi:hypothetical protein